MASLKTRYDLDQLKQLAIGRWSELLGLYGDSVNPKIHQPCPKCGGTKRFRVFDDFSRTGGVICNDCPIKSPDGIETYSWLYGVGKSEAIATLAEKLGLEPAAVKSGQPNGTASARVDGSKDSKSKLPADSFRWLDWNESLAALFCLRKPGIKSTSLVELGARLGTHYGTSVIALPIHDATNQIIGYAAASSTGGKMLIEHKGTDGQVQHSEQTSWKNVFPRGSAGIIATPNLLNAETRAGLTRIYKTEGPSDLLALIPLLQPGEGAFCNPSGAGENPEKFSWMLDWFDGKQVVVIHDRDNAGVAGALGDAAKGKPGFAGWAARTAEEVRNVELPYPLVEKNGRDLRDWIIEGGDLFGIQNLISDAPIINAVGIAVIEDGADPHYLARINLKNYEERHGRRLVFWKSEWYRWKSGCYVRIDDTELRSKVTLAVRNEFVIQWQDDLQRYREWQKSDKFDESRDKGPPKVKKVTPQLVGAVISAMASLTQLPGTTPMPCWLPDRSKRHYVSMKNGILDFDKVFAGRDIDEFLLPHSPNWFSQFQLQYKFDWDSKCPMWLEYLHYSMEGDQERVDLLQEWAGYLLTTTNYLQRFLVLEGKGGNGKTVYFAAMRAMLGNENVSSVALEKFGGRFDLATTLGRAANISGDVGEIDSVCEGTLKQFTGGDAMTFDRKNKEPLEAIPTAKLMMAWNLRPRFKDRSSGVWRRMLLVPFEREVPQEKRIAGMDSYEWWLASGEVPAILRWAIEGLDRLQTIGRFTHSKVSEDAIKNYRQESNPANDFLVEHCCETGDPRDRIEVQWLYDLYCLWCKNSGHTYPLAQNQLGKEVKRAFPSSDKKRFTFLGNREASEKDRDRAYFYTGIAFTVEKIAGKSTDSTIRD